MTGPPSDDETTENRELLETAASSTYKVLGDFSAKDGAAVLGKNTASSGTPIGIEGAVPQNSSDGYGLYTNHSARVKGTADVAALVFDDSAGDGNSFSVTEDSSTGKLEIRNGGTPTHKFESNGDMTVRGKLTENDSL